MIAYELSQHGQALVRLIEDARDAGDAELEASLTELRDSMLSEDEGIEPAGFLLERKRDWMELDARAAGARLLRDRMSAEIRALERAAKAEKELALMYMQARGITRQETDDPEVQLVERRRNGGKAPLWIDPGVEPSAAPRRYQQTKVDWDKDALRADCEAGTAPPFVRLEERGEHVR